MRSKMVSIQGGCGPCAATCVSLDVHLLLLLLLLLLCGSLRPWPCTCLANFIWMARETVVTSNDSYLTITSPPPAVLLLYRLRLHGALVLGRSVDHDQKFLFSHPPTPVGVLPSFGSYWLSKAAADPPSCCVQLCCLCLEEGFVCLVCAVPPGCSSAMLRRDDGNSDGPAEGVTLGILVPHLAGLAPDPPHHHSNWCACLVN